MKYNQSRRGFELVSPCPIPTTITTTPRPPSYNNTITLRVSLFFVNRFSCLSIQSFCYVLSVRIIYYRKVWSLLLPVGEFSSYLLQIKIIFPLLRNLLFVWILWFSSDIFWVLFVWSISLGLILPVLLLVFLSVAVVFFFLIVSSHCVLLLFSFISSSSSCHAASNDFPGPLSPPVSIVYRSQHVLQATSCIITARLEPPKLCYHPWLAADEGRVLHMLSHVVWWKNISSSWSSNLCTSMWRGLQEYIAYEFALTFPAVSRMSGSSNSDSFRDGW